MCMECFEGGLFLPYNPWVHASEKSQAAERRERVVTEKFNNVKNEQERSLLENAKALLALGAQSESNSPLKLIPSTLICEILEFAQGEKKGNIGNDSNNSAGGSATSIPAVREDFGVNFSDMSMYTPGNKIVVPLTMPNTHLTGPCWRDFSRAVRTHTGWNVKRIAATPEQKMQYGETRKGKVYFINAIFTVPGQPVREKKRTAALEKKKLEAADGAMKPPAAKKTKKQQNAA